MWLCGELYHLDWINYFLQQKPEYDSTAKYHTQNIWFQQNGAISHTIRVEHYGLKGVFSWSCHLIRIEFLLFYVTGVCEYAREHPSILVVIGCFINEIALHATHEKSIQFLAMLCGHFPDAYFQCLHYKSVNIAKYWKRFLIENSHLAFLL